MIAVHASEKRRAATQAAIGFILLAIGGILVIWYCCTRTLGPKPQPREDLRPMLDLEPPPVRKPASRAAIHASGYSFLKPPLTGEFIGDPKRKRDKRGRFAKTKRK